MAAVDVKIIMAKIAIGAALAGGEFTFGIFDQNDTELYTASNDANGRIIFPAVQFSEIGVYKYTVKEIAAPIGCVGDSKVLCRV